MADHREGDTDLAAIPSPAPSLPRSPALARFARPRSKVRDGSPSSELFDAVLEARVLADRYRKHYNRVGPHSALDYRPPAPEAIMPWPLGAALPAAQAELAS